MLCLQLVWTSVSKELLYWVKWCLHLSWCAVPWSSSQGVLRKEYKKTVSMQWYSQNTFTVSSDLRLREYLNLRRVLCIPLLFFQEGIQLLPLQCPVARTSTAGPCRVWKLLPVGFELADSRFCLILLLYWTSENSVPFSLSSLWFMIVYHPSKPALIYIRWESVPMVFYCSEYSPGQVRYIHITDIFHLRAGRGEEAVTWRGWMKGEGSKRDLKQEQGRTGPC